MSARCRRGRQQDRRQLVGGWRRLPCLLVGVLAGALLAACGATTGAATPGTPASSTRPSPVSIYYPVPTPLEAAPPGAIVSSQPVSTSSPLPAGATAFRVLYHSESIDDTDITVSGLVVVPGGAPPPEGFPIVTWAHGTTGLGDQCAPSLVGPSSIPLLDPLLQLRDIVVATDYQGLGTPGVPAYLVGQSEAQGALDAARAARNLEGRSASNTVVVLGFSQGGQGALFAGQIAQSYAPELFVAGVVAVAPAVSLDELVPSIPGRRAASGTAYAVAALVAWSSTYGNLELASELTPEVLHLVPAITSSCVGALSDLIDALPTDQVFRPGWATVAAMQADIAANAAGQATTSAPIDVVQGTADPVIHASATARFVSSVLCRHLHDTVDYLPVAGADHGSVLSGASNAILTWITGRFSGTPVSQSCDHAVASAPR